MPVTRPKVALLLLALTLASGLLVAEGYGVQGRVVDGKGRPVPGAVVEAYTLGGALVAKTSAGGDGFFSLQLEGGVYDLVFYAKGFAEKRVRVDLTQQRFLWLGDVELDCALKVSVEADRIGVAQGDAVDLGVTVANAGRYEERVNVSLAYPAGWSVKLLQAGGAEVSGFSLGPGQSVGFTLRLRVARNASGTYAVTVVFEGSSRVERRLLVDVRPREWGFVSAPYTRVAVTRGGELAVELSLRNTLGEDSDFSLEVSGPSGWGLALETPEGYRVSSVALKKGSEARLTLRVSVPEGAGKGAYTVVVRACAPGACSELALEVEVVEGSDRLVVESPSPFVEVGAGERAVIPLRVYNKGTSATLASFEVRGLPPNFTYSLKKEDGGLVTGVYLQPGGEARLALEVNAPYGFGARTVSFELVARGEKSNSTVRLGLSVVERRSLRILTENFYLSMATASSGKFELRVRNDGSSVLTNVRVGVVQAPKGLSVEVEPAALPSLPPGGEATFTLTVNADPNLAAGFYHVDLRVEAPGVSAERTLMVDVRPQGGYVYVGAALLVVAAALVLYVWRRYGRR